MLKSQLSLLCLLCIVPLGACGSSAAERPARPVEATLEAQLGPPDALEAEVEPEAVEEPEPLPELSAFEPSLGQLFVVDSIEGRTFVVLELVSLQDRRHSVESDWNWNRTDVTAHPREVPTDFRLIGGAAECGGTRGRSVVITSHSVPWPDDDDDRYDVASTYVFSAVEIDASCEARFAVTAEHEDRFEWVSPTVEREFGHGVSSGDRVLRQPVGVRGRLGRLYRFEGHSTCDHASTMEIRRGARRTRFTWGGPYSPHYGLVRVDRRVYFAELSLEGWVLHPVPASSAAAPLVPVHPSYTSLDVGHIEMELWFCGPPE